METLLQDLRYAARMLLKKPGFTLIAVVTLALGIGANTAIFSVVNAVLLRPLPFPQAERIMSVGRDYVGVNQVGPVDDPRFLFWREQSQSFEALSAAMSMGAGVNLAGGAEPEFVPALKVSVDFFRVLGVSPASGRSFTAEEDQAGGEGVAILSDGLWRRRFGADGGIVGKTISINGESYTVVGIMPPGFRFTEPAEVFTPLRPGRGSGNAGFNLNVLGRLKPGVTREQALAEMKLIVESLRAKEPKMIVVLLIACANVANLQLTRAASRHKEMAVRMALGAGWRRIVRQLLTEAVLLALVGAAAGLLLAAWGTEVLARFIPEGLMPRVDEIGFDWRVLAFTLAAAIATGVVFGLAPALRAARVDLNEALKAGAGKGAAGASRTRLHSALVVTEIALALVLLIGATLLIRTFAKLRSVDPGFDPHHVLTFRIKPSGERYETASQVADFNRRAIERIKNLPGVEFAAAINALPLEGQYNLPVEFEDKLGQMRTVQFRLIAPDYFRVMKIGLRQGREFAEHEREEHVVIVNDAFARQYLTDVNPLGQQIFVGRPLGAPQPLHIVGVVGDAKQSDLATDAPPAVFVPDSQVQPELWKLVNRSLAMRFVMRTAGESLSLGSAVKREMLNVDPMLSVTNLRSMEEVLSRSIGQQRFNMLIVGIFAGLGLALTAIGIYGVVSYAVAQRTHELGIRLALGAQVGDVLRLILKQGVLLALGGVAIGLAGAFVLTRVIKGFLFGVSATDPPTFIFVSALLMVVTLLACYLPARRATRVDPIVALRYE